MNTGTRLGLYGGGLALVFAAAFGTAALTVPDGAADEWNEHDRGGEGHGGGEPRPVRGLSIEQDGYRLGEVAAPSRRRRGGRRSPSRSPATTASRSPSTPSPTRRTCTSSWSAPTAPTSATSTPNSPRTAPGPCPWTWDAAGHLPRLRRLRPRRHGEGPDVTLTRTVEVAGEYAAETPAGTVLTAEVDGLHRHPRGRPPGRIHRRTHRLGHPDGEPVTDIEPYLGAFGHLVALREGDLAYLHVHPEGDEPAPGDLSGPAGHLRHRRAHRRPVLPVLRLPSRRAGPHRRLRRRSRRGRATATNDQSRIRRPLGPERERKDDHDDFAAAGLGRPHRTGDRRHDLRLLRDADREEAQQGRRRHRQRQLRHREGPIEAPAGTDPASLIAVVEKTGYTAALPQPPNPNHPKRTDRAARPRTGLACASASSARRPSVPVIAMSMVPALQFDYWQWASLALAWPVVLWSAWPFHKAGVPEPPPRRGHYGHARVGGHPRRVRVVPVRPVPRHRRHPRHDPPVRTHRRADRRRRQHLPRGRRGRDHVRARRTLLRETLETARRRGPQGTAPHGRQGRRGAAERCGDACSDQAT